MMDIIISGESEKPIYRQLFDQISAQIIKGKLAPDSMLPSIRTVAKELSVSVITIKKAWEVLESAGFIYSVVGKGCFVAKLSQKQLSQKQIDIASTKIVLDLAYYKELGISLDELITLIKKYYEIKPS